MSIFTKISEILNPVNELIDQVFTNKEEKAEALAKIKKAELEIQNSLFDFADKTNKAQLDLIKVENESQSWFVKNWRGIFFMIINLRLLMDWLALPFINMFLETSVVLPGLPKQAWDLMLMGMGGYTLLLGGSKAIKEFRKK